MAKNQLNETKTDRLSLRKLKNSEWRVILFLHVNKEVSEFIKRSTTKIKEIAIESISKINKELKQYNSLFLPEN